MQSATTLFAFALAITVASAQNWIGSYSPQWNQLPGYTQFNASANQICDQQNGGCDVDMNNYPGGGANIASYAGNNHGSGVYNMRIHNTGTGFGNLWICNSSWMSSGGATLNFFVDQSFTSNNIFIGYTGILTTQATQANSISIVTNYLAATFGGRISGNAFKATVNVNSFVQSSTMNVNQFIAYNQASWISATLNAASGYLHSAVATYNGANINAPTIWMRNPYQSDPANTIAATCDSSTVFSASNEIAHSSPFVSNGCVFSVPSGSLTIVAAINMAATNASSKRDDNMNEKRDGSTSNTAYNGGSSIANNLIQTSSYLSNLLKKREVNSKRAIVSWPNTLVLSDHQMTIQNSIQQGNSQAVISLSTCGSKMNIPSSASTNGITTACTNSITVVYKRSDVEEAEEGEVLVN